MLYQNIVSWLCSFTSSQLKERDTIKMIVHLNDKQENLKRHDSITHPRSDSLWAVHEVCVAGWLWFVISLWTLSSWKFIIAAFLKGWSAQHSKHTNFCKSGLWLSNWAFKEKSEVRTQIIIWCTKLSPFIYVTLHGRCVENAKRRCQQMEEVDCVPFSWLLALKYSLNL